MTARCCTFAGFVAAALVLTTTTARAEPPKVSPEQIEFFEKKVRPVLAKQCYSCHSAMAKKLKGDLLLDTRDGVLKGGASGSPAVVPDHPEKSPLIQAVRHAKDVAPMPPESKLTAAEIADLEAWVKMGAPDPRVGAATTTKRLDPARAREFWSFQPVRLAAVPEIANHKSPITNPIDAFIFAKLAEKGLSPAPPADKRTLIRRATFDLIGLPPTPEDIDAFLKDDSPEAFAKVVDQLLASPHYGERWGRHWLDVVRYADTAGDNSDYPIPQMYRYRNWVIDAFNKDMPYDEFIRQQLAGDLLPAKDDADRYAKLIATGYLANTKRFGSYEDARYPWYLTYEDTIDNLGKTFLGLTIGCCRCHDHKFDPLSQEDYYALYGFFSSTRYPWPGTELDKTQHDFVPLAPADKVAAAMKERQDKFAEFDGRIKKLEDERKVTEKELAGAEKLKDGDEKKARVAELNKKMEANKAAVKKARDEKEAFGKKPLPFEMAYAVAEGKTGGNKKVGNACVQIKGDPERLGPEVPRRFPTGLGGQALPADAKGSGRLELANWIADPKNPLTARVMVNRIWHYHFGKGIVPTPGNFGAMGQAPTHPELLDWLTREFVKPTKPTDSNPWAFEARPWSIKHLHRLIVLSRTYQMSSNSEFGMRNAELKKSVLGFSIPNSEFRNPNSVDVNNDFRWRFDRRRLDGESIRDTLLAVGGNLDRTPGGGHPFPAMASWNFTQHNPFKAVYDHEKRSVYLMTQRIQRHPFLALFDGADANGGTAARLTSTTPLQALYLMNDPFVHAQAKKFAARLLKERDTDAARIERAYLLLFGRPPTTEETATATDYLAKVTAKLGGERPTAAAWESLARALFQTNEFVYVE